MNRLIVRKPDEAHETLNMIGEQFTVLATGDDTSSYEVFVQVVPPGAGPPLHSHPWDEAFYVLSGELNFSTDEQTLRAPAGTFVHFPAGHPHAFSSRVGTSSILSFTSRPGAAAFFRESNRVNAEFPGDLEKLFSVGPRHHVSRYESTQQYEQRTKSAVDSAS